ncbi:MAG: hypothetical protein JOZ74_04640 [Bradyrhizobium sp.]|nr:hypothetical protein [Bradyrhizobium sp.]
MWDHAVIAISASERRGRASPLCVLRCIAARRIDDEDFLPITNAAFSGDGTRASAPSLFHDAQPRMPPLGGSCGGAVPLLAAHDFLAQDLQLGIADLIQLHAQIENGDREQLGGFVPAARAKRSATLFERFEHGK